jgi:hypothetical protein
VRSFSLAHELSNRKVTLQKQEPCNAENSGSKKIVSSRQFPF